MNNSEKRVAPEARNFRADTFKHPWTFTNEDWMDILGEEKYRFKGDKVHAAKMLYFISQAILDGLKNYSVNTKKDSAKIPKLAIAYSGNVDQLTVEAKPTYNVILLSIEYLSNLSKIPQGKTVPFIRADGEVYFIGTTDNLFTDHGAEEIDHMMFHQKYPELIGKSPNALNMTLVEYDSIDVEFASFPLRIKLLKKKNAPYISIQFIRERFKDAKKLRKSLEKRI